MPKFKSSNSNYWVISKHCVTEALVINGESERPDDKIIYYFHKTYFRLDNYENVSLKMGFFVKSTVLNCGFFAFFGDREKVWKRIL